MTPELRRPSAELRALPQLPSSNSASNSRQRRSLNVPATVVEELAANGLFNDIHASNGDAPTSRVNSGHHTAVDSVSPGRTSYWRVEDPYHYIDIDQQAAVQPGGGDQSVSSRGYEGLDPAVLAALGQQQTQRSRVYAGLTATRHTDTEVTASPNTVTHSLLVFYSRSRLVCVLSGLAGLSKYTHDAPHIV